MNLRPIDAPASTYTFRALGYLSRVIGNHPSSPIDIHKVPVHIKCWVIFRKINISITKPFIRPGLFK